MTFNTTNQKNSSIIIFNLLQLWVDNNSTSDSPYRDENNKWHHLNEKYTKWTVLILFIWILNTFGRKSRATNEKNELDYQFL